VTPASQPSPTKHTKRNGNGKVAAKSNGATADPLAQSAGPAEPTAHPNGNGERFYRTIPDLDALDQEGLATVLLGLRRDGWGDGRVAGLADVTGLSCEHVERLLCLGVRILAGWGWQSAALCAEFKLSPEQVTHALSVKGSVAKPQIAIST
jgi:hypothetical protein